MISNPEVRISGRLRDTLKDLRAVTNDRQLSEWMDAGQEHASFHSLVATGVRGLRKYLTGEDARIEPRGEVELKSPGRSRTNETVRHRLAPETEKKAGSDVPVLGGFELAERSLAVIDAALSSAAHCPDYESSLAVQEGLAHIRERIRAAVQNLRREDHRSYLELLAESLCRELSLRAIPFNGR